MTEFFNQTLDWIQQNPEYAGLVVFAVSLAESLAIVGVLVPGVIILLGAGVVAVPIATRFGLGSVLGYLLAGTLVGPFLVHGQAVISVAEFGVSLLLFSIGLEFSFAHTHAYGETYFSFVNGQYTNDGGTHQSAFREGLLKGINDSPVKMWQLCETIHAAYVRPYYVFNCSYRNPQFTHFRVPLETGRDIVESMYGNISGDAIPRYIATAGGKIPLHRSNVVSGSDGQYVLKKPWTSLERFQENGLSIMRKNNLYSQLFFQQEFHS